MQALHPHEPLNELIYLRIYRTNYCLEPLCGTIAPAYLKHIGNDKEVSKYLPLLSHCKQSNDPGEAHHRDKDDGGLEQTPSVCEENMTTIMISGNSKARDIYSGTVSEGTTEVEVSILWSQRHLVNGVPRLLAHILVFLSPFILFRCHLTSCLSQLRLG